MVSHRLCLCLVQEKSISGTKQVKQGRRGQEIGDSIFHPAKFGSMLAAQSGNQAHARFRCEECAEIIESTQAVNRQQTTDYGQSKEPYC